jgi:hypothetical protein
MCGHQRVVVQLVLLLAVSIASDAAFARAGPLHLFSSEAHHPTVSGPVVSSSLTLAGCGRGRYRDSATQKCRGPADIDARPPSKFD